MREISLMIVALLAAGCGGNNLSNSDADIAQKDARCAQLADAQSCAADQADACVWIAYGRPCPATGPCVAGVCQGPVPGGGTIHDGGCVPPSPKCATFNDETSCAADTADHCIWYGTGQDCPPNYPGTCSSGVCQGATDPACSSGGDGGSAGVGCACPNGGVCVQKDGAPIACEQPIAQCIGGSSACGCLPSSDGSCVPSSDVIGLCICTTPAPSGCNCAAGQICVEQIGGPAMQVGSPPNLLCVTPTPNCSAGSSCGCVSGQGHCSPSTSGPAQCTCDNGIR